ncbi:hypothetical protein TWF718_010699 [Orbilia javanica]|uniref:Uncharacterized protein n=1 Tax=Orbilia javanica TaxID=47235 RepID=A0AAN8RL97_9PEZI
MADPPASKPPADGDNYFYRSTSLRHPDLPSVGDDLPWQYQSHSNREQYTYKLICLDRNLIVYEDESDTSNKDLHLKSQSQSQSQPNDEKPQIPNTAAAPTTSLNDHQERPENIPISTTSYKDLDNPTALVNDPTQEPSTPEPTPKNYRPTYRYFLTEAQDFDHGDMLAIFSVCRSYDESYIRPIIELMPDALFAIQTIKASLNADERRNGTNKEWELAHLFYFLVDGGIACLFLERREASGLRNSTEIRECIKNAEVERDKTETEEQVVKKRSLMRRVLRLPPKKPRRPPTEEEIRRTEEIIMAIRII